MPKDQPSAVAFIKTLSDRFGRKDGNEDYNFRHNSYICKNKKMRLSKSEIKTIKSVACQVWGNQTHIYLFGSRTDDSKKGGDIDLYINLQEEQAPKEIMLKKAEFLGKLDFLLGEQKIDLLVRTQYNNHLSIIKTALLTGVEL